MKHSGNFFASALLPLASLGWTQEPAADQVLAYGGRVAPPMTGPAVAASPAGADSAPAEPRKWDHALPFFAQRVIDKGIDLPNPYDIGISYYSSHELRRLSSLNVGFNGSTPTALDFVQFPRAAIKNQSVQAQAGAWLLPFMNVYVLAGHTQGTGDIDITMDGAQLMQYLGIPGCNLAPALRPQLCSQTLSGTAHAKYTGSSAGIGTTVAGAWRNLFFALPISYVVAHVTQSDQPSKTWNIAPRVGYNQRLGGEGMLTWYAGGTYMKSDFDITGTADFNTTNTVIGRPTSMRYSIHVQPKEPWNYLGGVNWTIDKRWSAMAEAGFGGSRSDLLFTAFYRF